MEENSKFSGLQFRQAKITSGAKISGGADPVISINSTYNSFTLSPKAKSLLGVDEGSYVQLYDMAGLGATSINDRFYISVGFMTGKTQQGAKIGKNGGFTFNVAWGAFMVNDLDIKEITGDQLVARDLAILREMTLKNGQTQKSYIAKQKATGTLVPYGVDEDGKHQPIEVADGVEVLLYSITDIEFQEHTPRIGEEEGEE